MAERIDNGFYTVTNMEKTVNTHYSQTSRLTHAAWFKQPRAKTNWACFLWSSCWFPLTKLHMSASVYLLSLDCLYSCCVTRCHMNKLSRIQFVLETSLSSNQISVNVCGRVFACAAMTKGLVTNIVKCYRSARGSSCVQIQLRPHPWSTSGQWWR